MKHTYTQTEAILPISDDAFHEIKSKLLDAGYFDAIKRDRTGTPFISLGAVQLVAITDPSDLLPTLDDAERTVYMDEAATDTHQCRECGERKTHLDTCGILLRRRVNERARFLGEDTRSDSTRTDWTPERVEAAQRAAKLAQLETSSANARQVGGAHYGLSALQHWDIVSMFNLDYFQGNITKYVFRHKSKNGIQDLRKAQHYLEKYIELLEGRSVDKAVEAEQATQYGTVRA